jgi:hypothetical protein
MQNRRLRGTRNFGAELALRPAFGLGGVEQRVASAGGNLADSW